MATTVHIIGAGTPTPTSERFGSAYVVDTGATKVMFDCGPAATHKLAKAGLFPTQIDYLFFTHHHFDHDADYPCFLLCRWDQSIGVEATLRIFGPSPTAGLTDALIGPQGAFAHDWKARINWPTSLQVYQNRGGKLPRTPPSVNATDIGPSWRYDGTDWSVRSAVAEHAQPWLDSLAYRITTTDSDIVITGDTEMCDSVIELARDSDFLLCMCWDHTATMSAEKEVAGQCGTVDAAEMAQRAGVRTLVLVHTGPRLEGEDQHARALEEMTRVFDGEILFADELDAIDTTLT
jgi:ribonuclease Z